MQTDRANQYNQLLSLGEGLLREENFQQLNSVCSQLANQFPTEHATWLLLAKFGLKINNLDYAGRALEEADKLGDNSVELRLTKALYQLRSGRKKQALDIIDIFKGADSKKLSAENLTELAGISYQLNKIDWSKDFYRQAIATSPRNSHLYYNLAAAEQYLGNLEESLANCELALELDPDHHEAIFLRSNLFKQSLASNHIEQLKEFIERQPESSLAKVMGCYALAKELEDCKNYRQSFSWRSKGAALYRKRFQYDVFEDVRFMRRIEEVYKAELFSHSQAGMERGEQAIFIIGLPRTGSTLVERIITSHSDVESAGELTHFPNLLTKFIQENQQQGLNQGTDYVELTKSFNFEQLGKEYLEMALQNRTTKKRFVDKFPQNALYAGLIHLALPRAKIILVERDPMDVCYAMYKQLFTDIYQFSYDLNELAEYYAAHYSLMTHWKESLSDNLFTIKYEDLIEDYQTNSRRLIEFCDLEWQDQCDDFQSNPHVTATASAAQVRKPLYSSSIGMWRNYQEFFHTVKVKLESLKIWCE